MMPDGGGGPGGGDGPPPPPQEQPPVPPLPPQQDELPPAEAEAAPVAAAAETATDPPVSTVASSEPPIEPPPVPPASAAAAPPVPVDAATAATDAQQVAADAAPAPAPTETELAAQQGLDAPLIAEAANAAAAAAENAHGAAAAANGATGAAPEASPMDVDPPSVPAPVPAAAAPVVPEQEPLPPAAEAAPVTLQAGAVIDEPPPPPQQQEQQQQQPPASSAPVLDAAAAPEKMDVDEPPPAEAPAAAATAIAPPAATAAATAPPDAAEPSLAVAKPAEEQNKGKDTEAGVKPLPPTDPTAAPPTAPSAAAASASAESTGAAPAANDNGSVSAGGAVPVAAVPEVQKPAGPGESMAVADPAAAGSVSATQPNGQQQQQQLPPPAAMDIEPPPPPPTASVSTAAVAAEAGSDEAKPVPPTKMDDGATAAVAPVGETNTPAQPSQGGSPNAAAEAAVVPPPNPNVPPAPRTDAASTPAPAQQQQQQQPPPRQQQPVLPPQQQQQGMPPHMAPVRMQQPPPQQQGGGPPRGHIPPPQQQPHQPQQHGGAPPPMHHQQHPPGPAAAGSGAAVAAGGGGPQQGGGGGPPSSAGQGQMRELKVEDALLYLDQVKLEFGDRPRIYNEFLEIMKNFKAQEIDTPGVIRRVSTLFRGYNNLILGFNTFLPEGYKIELKDLEVGGIAGPARIPPAPPGYGQGGPQGMGRGGPQQSQQQQQQQQQPYGAGPTAAGRGGPAGGMAPPGFQQGRAQGGAPPQGVAPGRAQPQQMQQQQGRPPHMQGQGQQMTPQQQQQQGQPMGGQPGQQMQQQQPPQQQQGGPGHAVEFDHAITYVTTIKKRFANDPRTYQTFLEILHTYQKEQRGIKEVLEQVSNLFADHPDLLKEFTFFLPDAVQEQAKERLARAAAEAEERRRQMLQAQAAQQAQFSGQQYMEGGKKGMGRGRAKGQQGDFTRSPPPPPLDAQKFIDMTAPHGKGASPGQMRKRALDGTIQPIVSLHPPQPAELVYNAGVERQFFDAAKEALTSYSRDGGQAWAEFLKCLDMYAQEVLSRSEMLGFVEPLLGKRNTELFEEFKRILASAGAPNAPIHDDAWHSVPLSEIDFSRCRRCSPSYRALPRDYPAPPCSERSEMEAKVLNDVWVSLPVGSEESYTFRHMRKNQYEEVLFRCEDERFEIDMTIDSNAATLRRLEPIAEEIAQLSNKELATPNLADADQTIGKKNSKDKTVSSTTAGLGGKKFQYTLDRRILNTIHKHSIMRIYGDAGEEMFDLLFKNPTMAVPVVVKRLRQKEREWKAARDVLNLRWKELAEVNYYKSLDHQSLTWRTTDKRATSTRTLVAEIKDRAANNGEEGEAAVSARKDKMKEEYGSFYEVTMGRYMPKKLNLAALPKPAKPLFTPHLSLLYENNSWVHRDAYRILMFALERGSISPMDKERCHRLWRDFLAHLFGLDLVWMQNPAISYASSPHGAPTVVSNGEESGDDDSSKSGDENDNDIEGDVVVTEEVLKDDKGDDEIGDDGDFDGMSFVLDQQPIPVGAQVSTIYGEGTVTKFRKVDRIYVVSLPYGAKAYVRPDAILCTIYPVEKSSLTDQLRAADKDVLKGPNDKLIIGTQSLYLFFRLHHVLLRRLAIAKDLAYKASKDRSIRTHVEQMIADGPEDIGRKRYDAFLSLIYGLIEGAYTSQGAAEGGKYEDRVRCLLGQGAYELATMDKLISHIQKHLQNMAGDEAMTSLVDTYRRHVQAGSFKPGAFRQEAAYLSEGDNMFAFQYCQVPGSDKSVMHYEFLGDIAESEDDDDNSIEGGTKKDMPDAVMADEGAVETSEPSAPKRQRRGS